MKNDHDVTQEPKTPEEMAQAQIAAIHADMSEVDAEKIFRDSYERSQHLIRKYSAEIEIERDYGGGPSWYVIQLGPVVRISGQLGVSDVVETARMEYQNESTPWLGLRVTDDEQRAVQRFVRQILML